MHERKSAPVTINKESKLPRLDIYKTQTIELPVFDASKIRSDEYEKQLAELSQLKKKLKCLADDESLEISHYFRWNAISNDLMIQRISRLNTITNDYRFIIFLFNIETKKHYYLFNVPNTNFTSIPNHPNCLMNLYQNQIRFWDLNTCEDHGTPICHFYKMDSSPLPSIYLDKIQFFSTKNTYQFLTTTANLTQINNSQFGYHHQLYFIDLDCKKDSERGQHAIVKYFSYDSRQSDRNANQILNQNEMMMFVYDFVKKQTSIIFCDKQFKTFHQIQLSDLEIKEKEYKGSFISPQGKYLVIVCQNTSHAILKSFSLCKNENNQYYYKPLSQIKFDKEYSCSTYDLSSSGYFQWTDDSVTYNWNIKNAQVMTVHDIYTDDVSSYDSIFMRSDSGFSTLEENTESKSILTCVKFEDPRIMLETRKALRIFSDDMLAIVAGYVSQNTSTFFAGSIGALTKLRSQFESKGLRRFNPNTHAALTTFFAQERIDKPLDVCATKALKRKPDEEVANLLDKFLSPYVRT